MNITSRIILLSLLSLLFAGACQIFTGGPKPPEEKIPVSETEAQTVLNTWESIFSSDQSGLVSITLTEAQVTSAIDRYFSTQETPFMTEPQVYLRDGKIDLYGKISQGLLSANVRLTLSATIDDKGKPELTIIDADFGPLPMPDSLLNAASKLIDESVTGMIGPMITKFKAETIDINNGLLIISGRKY